MSGKPVAIFLHAAFSDGYALGYMVTKPPFLCLLNTPGKQINRDLPNTFTYIQSDKNAACRTWQSTSSVRFWNRTTLLMIGRR